MDRTSKILFVAFCLIAGALITRIVVIWDEPGWEKIILYSIFALEVLSAIVLFIFLYGVGVAEEQYTSDNEDALLPPIDVRSIGLMKPGPYIIHKRDGSPVDPDAEYFVLRLDFNGDDLRHVEACRLAIRAYAMNISDHLPLLAKDLLDKYGSVKA